MTVAERIEAGVKSGRISAPIEKKKALKEKEGRSTMLKVATEVGKTNSKTTTLHPKLLTSTLALHFLLENLSLKSKTKLKIFKGSRNNYLHYHFS